VEAKAVVALPDLYSIFHRYRRWRLEEPEGLRLSLKDNDEAFGRTDRADKVLSCS